MKVLLLKDVYKLGRAGDVKKVANGYGRNYLIPQGLAVLATTGAMKQADRIRTTADVRRTVLNQELSGVAEILSGKVLTFAVRASETGRLYGSVTTRMVADLIKEKLEVDISHRQVELEPIRNIGKFIAPIRLTIDLAPELTVIVHREGAAPDLSDEEEEDDDDDDDDDDEEVEEVYEIAEEEAEEEMEEAEAAEPVAKEAEETSDEEPSNEAE
jgi:large subunit ribosomal protein L9